MYYIYYMYCLKSIFVFYIAVLFVLIVFLFMMLALLRCYTSIFDGFILSKRRSPTNFPLWVRVVEEMGILSFLIVLRSDFEGTLHYQNNHHQCHFDLIMILNCLLTK